VLDQQFRFNYAMKILPIRLDLSCLSLRGRQFYSENLSLSQLSFNGTRCPESIQINKSEQKVGFVNPKWAIDFCRVQQFPNRLTYSFPLEKASIDHPSSPRCVSSLNASLLSNLLN